jgi:all-trans-retinol 13,14-reductase
MHIFGGLQRGGNLRLILEYLDVIDKLTIEPYYDTIANGEETITLPWGREAWIEAIGQGKYKDELNAYVDALYRYADSEDLFNMRPNSKEKREEPNISAQKLIAQYISDPKVQDRLAYVAHLYDGTADSPALIHALTSVLHINGIYSLSPSVHCLADALCDIIIAGGGAIHKNCTVSSIEANNGEVTAVVCDKQRFTADYYISAISIGALLRIAPPSAFSTAFRKRITAARQSCSAFCLYGILKPHTIPFHHDCYHISRPNSNPWNNTDCPPDQWPQNMFLMLQADNDNPQYASEFNIVAPMDYEYVRQWEDTTTGHRPDNYQQWKKQMADQAMQVVQHTIGRMETEIIYTASPLTFRDFNNTTQGTCYGLHTSVDNPLLTTLSTRTRLKNLFLTGQDVNFHGMVGTALTAILTSETIVGQNKIVNKIIQKHSSSSKQ